MAVFVAGDTGSKLRITCTDDGTSAAIDLTSMTVMLRWRNSDGEVEERAMTVTNAAAGIAEYQFAADELEQGVMAFDVRITDATSKYITNVIPINESVRAPVE